jgi:hypothetical protein
MKNQIKKIMNRIWSVAFKCRICNPFIIIFFFKETTIFKQCVMMCESKNGHQKDVCFKKNGLHVLILLIVLSSIIDIIGVGDLCDPSMNSRIFTLMMNKIFIVVLQKYEANHLWTRLEIDNHLALIASMHNGSFQGALSAIKVYRGVLMANDE